MAVWGECTVDRVELGMLVEADGLMYRKRNELATPKETEHGLISLCNCTSLDEIGATVTKKLYH